MKKTYKKVIELEDYYKDMKKKYPNVEIWDNLLDLLKQYKNKIFSVDNDFKS